MYITFLVLWVQVIQRTCTFFLKFSGNSQKIPRSMYFTAVNVPILGSQSHFLLRILGSFVLLSLYTGSTIVCTHVPHSLSLTMIKVSTLKWNEMKWNESITACTCITAPSLLEITDDTTWGLQGLPHSFTRIRQYTRCLLAWRLFLEFDETNSNNSTRINTNITLSEANTMIL